MAYSLFGETEIEADEVGSVMVTVELSIILISKIVSFLVGIAEERVKDGVSYKA